MEFSTLEENVLVGATIASMSVVGMSGLHDPVKASETVFDGSRPHYEKLSESELRDVTAKGLPDHLLDALTRIRGGNFLGVLKGLPERFIPKQGRRSQLEGLKQLVFKNRTFDDFMQREFIQRKSIRTLRKFSSFAVDLGSIVETTRLFVKSLSAFLKTNPENP